MEFRGFSIKLKKHVRVTSRLPLGWTYKEKILPLEFSATKSSDRYAT